VSEVQEVKRRFCAFPPACFTANTGQIETMFRHNRVLLSTLSGVFSNDDGCHFCAIYENDPEIKHFEIL